ncbi:energy transducer TonB [Vibrio sp. DW001]|uniref:energy transducer TonB n=1 Tax=Vibrio sp. DW001 TaxID=2912315 RepID=UPI0023B18785|nr:energy transducer TonB [Vibrio sp. DW001]WED27671.1 energy transducer TonB [Vibrio sp. DW001]
MNGKRYVIFGSVSLALHSLMLLAQPAQNALTVSLDSTTANMHLQFVAAPKKAMPIPQETHVEPQKSQPTIVEKQAVKKDTELKKPIDPKKTIVPIKPIAERVTTKNKMTKSSDIKNERALTVEKEPLIKETKTSTRADIPSKPVESAVSTSRASTPMLIKKPTFTARPTPVSYPRLAKRRGQQGKVLIEVWIDDHGNQIKQFIVDSSGFSTLDGAALTAISNWKFDVSTDRGHAIAHRVQIPVNFKLDR